MGEACDGPCLPAPHEGGRVRSTPLEAAPAAENMGDERIALSDELVVEVLEVLLGDRDLDLVIRIYDENDECGDVHEVPNLTTIDLDHGRRETERL